MDAEWTQAVDDEAIEGVPVDLVGSEAIEKLDWYAMRWKIEVFHKILKLGCKAEDSKLRTADRLANRKREAGTTSHSA